MPMKFAVGDLVQLGSGAVDLISGKRPRAGSGYLEGGSLWGSVNSIVDKFKARDISGGVREVTKVAVSDNLGNIQWQVEAAHIASNIIKSSNPALINRAGSALSALTSVREFMDDPSIGGAIGVASRLGIDPSIIGGVKALANLTMLKGASAIASGLGDIFGGTNERGRPYVTTPNSTSVDRGGFVSHTTTSGRKYTPQKNITKVVGNEPFLKKEDVSYVPNEFTPSHLGVDINIHNIERQAIRTAMSDDEKRRSMLNEDVENIQNPHSFPAKIKASNGLVPARYDYQIDINDDRYSLNHNMEERLMAVRASVGLPVHGNNDIAKAMKYYMYNRFKTPDLNMVHSKSFTHVFFTRPDLNLLYFNGPANDQTRSNTETSMLWKRNPDLFKLLTDRSRCMDSNNFNLLLSNQCTAFDIQDESISTVEAGKSWTEHEMSYGHKYTSNISGSFNCTFIDTADYSVINLIKLWLTYIDNVSRGAWFPSYNLQNTGGASVSNNPRMSHVYSKTLDYAASCYVIKVGPDGEDILYWSKYYGIFPTNSGASALAWSGDGPNDTPKPNITFKYAYKRDMSPVALLEFNRAANIYDNNAAVAESSFNTEYGLSSRPYVGAPYIEMKLDDEPKGFPTTNGTTMGIANAQITLRLKFRKSANNQLTDDTMYRASMINRRVDSAYYDRPDNEYKATKRNNDRFTMGGVY